MAYYNTAIYAVNHSTADADYKNIVGNCIQCSYNRGISDTVDIAYKNNLGSRKYQNMFV